MRKLIPDFLAVAALLLSTVSSFASDADPQEFTQIERGRYLAILSDCASCHTVPNSNQPFRRRPADRNSVRQHCRSEHHAQC